MGTKNHLSLVPYAHRVSCSVCPTYSAGYVLDSTSGQYLCRECVMESADPVALRRAELSAPSTVDLLTEACRDLGDYRLFLDMKYSDVRGDELVYGRESFLTADERAEYSRLSKRRAQATSACTEAEVGAALDSLLNGGSK